MFKVFGTTFLALPYITYCFDAVIWSNDKNEKLFDHFMLDEKLSEASVDQPIVVFLVNGFTLADFSRFAKVYSDPNLKQKTGLTHWIRASEEYTAEWLPNSIQLPSQTEYNSDVSDDVLKSSSVVIVKLEDLSSIDETSDRIFSFLGSKPYLAVLTDNDITDHHKVSKRNIRVKRPSPVGDAKQPEPEPDTDTEPDQPDTDTEPDQPDTDAEPVDKPIKPVKPVIKPSGKLMSSGNVLPLFNNRSGKCIIYIEQVVVAVKNAKIKGFDLTGKIIKYHINGSWTVDVDCEKKTENGLTSSKFDIQFPSPVKTAAKESKSPQIEVDSLAFSLEFATTRLGYWQLSAIKVTDLKGNFGLDFGDKQKQPEGTGKITSSTMYSVPDFCYVCHHTDPIKIEQPINPATALTEYAYLPSNLQVKLYLEFKGFQVQPFLAKDGYFNDNNVDDCTPVFSAPILMGLITMFVMLIVLVFAITMISNLQSPERFENPKSKPLQINVKE